MMYNKNITLEMKHMKIIKYLRMKTLQGNFDHHFEGLFEKKNHFKEWISDYIMDHVLQIWPYLFTLSHQIYFA